MCLGFSCLLRKAVINPTDSFYQMQNSNITYDEDVLLAAIQRHNSWTEEQKCQEQSIGFRCRYGTLSLKEDVGDSTGLANVSVSHIKPCY